MASRARRIRNSTGNLIKVFCRWSVAMWSYVNLLPLLFGDNKRNYKLDTILQDMSRSETRLEKASVEFESGFMEVLHFLEKLDSISAKLNEESRRLLEMSSSHENPTLSINRCLEPSLNLSDDACAKLQQIIEELHNDRNKISQALSFQKKLDHTFSELDYLRTLFRVESAPLDPGAQSMFNELIKEIYRLQSNVAKIFREKFDQLAGHKKTISELIENLDVQSSSLTKKAQEKRRKLNAALQSQNKNLEERISSDSQLHTQCERIGDSIGQSIVALQSQDMINQKLQHIFEIAKDIKQRKAILSESKDRKERYQQFRFIEKASIVIVNQIQAIIAELAVVEKSIKENLIFIANSASAIEQSSIATSQDWNRIDTSGQDGTHDLNQALDDAEQIVCQTEKVLENGFSKIQPIRGMASNVTEIILGLSSKLHVIGLNAELHAGQMHGCYGLKTISANTSRVSIETRSLCQSVSTKLDSLVESLNTNVNDFETLYQEAKSDRIRLSDQCPIERENLHQFECDYEFSESSISEYIQKLSTLIANEGGNLDLRELMAGDLNKLENELRLLSEEAKEQADLLNENIDISGITDTLLERYTMQSEKNVHLKSMGVSVLEPPQRPREPVTIQFNEDTQYSYASQENGIDPFFEDFNVSQEPEKEESEKVNASKSQNYGDNVELF